MIKAQDVQKLREQTGAGMMDCKKALAEASGDFTKAVKILRQNDAAIAAKKSAREIHEGVIGSYVHSNNKIGVLVELNCETDFVARNAEFQELAHELAVHIAAANPEYLKPEDVPEKRLTEAKNDLEEDLKKSGKPKAVIAKAVEGRLKKLREEISLFNQPFYKDPDQTVGDLITAKTGKIGERLEVKRFVRYQL